MRKYLIIALLSFVNVTYSQGFKMHFSNSFADCFGAVEVTNFDIASNVQFPGDFGLRDDFIGLDPDFHEVNSVWLRLEPNLTGKFGFEISTENNVDFSYFLFKANDNSFCEKLESDRVSPLVFEMSSNKSKGVGDNKGAGFKPAIDCKEQDVYYLMIHTNSTYKGLVTVKYLREGKVHRAKAVVQDFRKTKDNNFIRVRIRDKETTEPVEANMIITGVGKDNYLFLGTDFYFDATAARDMHIESNTQGYFLFVKDFSIRDGAGSNVEILVELEKLAPGKKLALENIKFEQDSDDFIQIAYPALKRLLDFMAVNKNLRIEIQGHVNAPGYKNNSKIKALSENRAKAVKKFLKDNGIEGNRMEVNGYGNTEMIYEEPQNKVEEEANRRVEIKIID